MARVRLRASFPSRPPPAPGTAPRPRRLGGETAPPPAAETLPGTPARTGAPSAASPALSPAPTAPLPTRRRFPRFGALDFERGRDFGALDAEPGSRAARPPRHQASLSPLPPPPPRRCAGAGARNPALSFRGRPGLVRRAPASPRAGFNCQVGGQARAAGEGEGAPGRGRAPRPRSPRGPRPAQLRLGAMYAVYKQAHPPTGLEFSMYCNFFNNSERNLVVAGTSQLYVYRLNRDAEVGAGRSPRGRLLCSRGRSAAPACAAVGVRGERVRGAPGGDSALTGSAPVSRRGGAARAVGAWRRRDRPGGRKAGRRGGLTGGHWAVMSPSTAGAQGCFGCRGAGRSGKASCDSGFLTCSQRASGTSPQPGDGAWRLLGAEGAAWAQAGSGRGRTGHAALAWSGGQKAGCSDAGGRGPRGTQKAAYLPGTSVWTSVFVFAQNVRIAVLVIHGEESQTGKAGVF